MFTTFHNSLYRPLTWMTLGVDYLLWGMQASGYHLTSLLFHLPFTLLVLDTYPLKRLGWDRGYLGSDARRIWREKVPFFILAICGGVLALFGKQQSKLLYGLDQYGFIGRIVQSVYGFAFYPWKTLVPIRLSPLYEMRTLDVSDWRFLLSAIVLLAITAALWFLRRRWPWALAAWVYYLVIVAPYIGVAQNRPQIAARRNN